MLAAFAAAYLVAPVHLPADNPLTWVALFFAEDLAYYWFHRVAPRRPGLLGQPRRPPLEPSTTTSRPRCARPWTPFTALLFWVPLAFARLRAVDDPRSSRRSACSTSSGSTPSGCTGCRRRSSSCSTRPPTTACTTAPTSAYLDRNYGGILIVWDRHLRHLRARGRARRYGLTKNIRDLQPARVAFHEFADIARDVRRAAALARPARLPLPRPRAGPRPPGPRTTSPPD